MGHLARTGTFRLPKLGERSLNRLFSAIMTRVIVVLFEGVQTLDMTGPAEVFAAARRNQRSPYSVQFASVGGGVRQTSSALRVLTRDLARIRPRASDIVVVTGGEESAIKAALAQPILVRWLQRAVTIVRYMTSVCSGAFILASAGILDGKRATTHWRACQRLTQLFPHVQVDANAIFVRDGKVWTSAGVTTGIDMALAIVEGDHGRKVIDELAADLVLYVRRPGFQAQFSAALVTQTASSDGLEAALAWAREHLDQTDVEELARRAGLSVRTLHRRCVECLGTTPAKLIDKLRVDCARMLLSTTDLSGKALAARCGFGNTTRMKRAFERELGIPPREYRLLHSA